ncbi:cytochrome c3 family protein [Candidatus Contubernalis alkaliaceticus]|uniref:cytochrome c3 family protein n=1 Tax=Candidatus Contubernalis alkaliaceticus TaxID=338645 RepID=UPI001F4C4486|nr:NapC/NirT family cytochrome c [Candidatus Contubernalis alkalaceticus]UNC92967.1 NapC/NirT family cytochrome c [Candidatus Contubernalis alkalaceticus]
MSKKSIIIIAIVILLIVVNVAALKFTSTPSFCGSCHYMAESKESWEVSEHYKEAKCLDCHSDPGMIGYLMAKMNGIKELYVHLTEDVTRERIEAMDVHVNKESCIQCHQSVKDDGTHKLHESMECGQCHIGIGHGAEVDTITCNTCHPNM